MTTTTVSPAQMIIRRAAERDIPGIVEMGMEFHDTSEYKDYLKVSPLAISALATNLLAKPESESCILVLEKGNQLLGMIALLAFTHPFTGELTAGELVWWVSPEVRGYGVRLLRAAEKWARSAGAKYLQMVAPNEHVAHFYERLGYRLIESNYQSPLF